MDDLALLLDAARRASDIAMSFFRSDPKSWNKAGGSPVTEADIAVDNFLKLHLTAARPGYGWLSEETGESENRIDADPLFIVDPIDGTRGFMRGDTRWSISLAVVSRNRPQCGVLAVPAEDRVYHAGAGTGAYCNAKPIAVSRRESLNDAAIAGPKSWLADPLLSGLADPNNHAIPSLAYRIALVADGTLDGAFARPNSHDWDLAASDLLLKEAGGRLSDGDWDEPRYNQADITHNLLVAANPWIHTGLRALVGQVEHRRLRTQTPKSKGSMQ